MKFTHLLVRYGELFLKGGNRRSFEMKLVENIRRLVPGARIKRTQGRLILDYLPNHSDLKRGFGLVSYSPAVLAEKELPEIKKKAAELLAGKTGTFKVETKRSDKRFPFTSLETNKLVGEHVEKNTSLKFDFLDPRITLSVEINQEGSYLFTERIDCFGGMPVGSSGKVALLVEDQASLLAGLLFLKRGCSLLPLAFEEKDISLLQKYSPEKMTLKLVDNLKKVGVLVSGQTWENYHQYKTDALVFRPLIAYRQKQVKEGLEFYGR